MSEKKRINKLPAPTFRWLNMNSAEVNVIDENHRIPLAHFEGNGHGQEPLRYAYPFGGDQCIAPVAVTVQEKSEATVLLTCQSDEKKAFVMEAPVELVVKKGAAARIVYVQLLPDDMEMRSQIHATLEEDASFVLTQVILSGGKSYIECITELNGDRSRVQIETAYSLSGRQELDINYVADHFGKRTESAIDVYGVLSDTSQKIFRGTIDFKRGAKGAIGNEQEDVLLLDDAVVNRTIPLILCAEEDVEGNHGATIGKLADDLLFYLSSRGMNTEEIYEMMARARIDAVAAKIPDEQTRETIRQFMEDKGNTR